MKLFDSFYKGKTSSNFAKDRLKNILVSDKTNCSPEIMKQIQQDILDIISRYLEVDTANYKVDIMWTESQDEKDNIPVLYVNVPIKNLKAKTVK